MPHQAQPADGAIPEPDEPRILSARDPPPGRAGDPAELTLLLAQDRDRIAGALNDVVITPDVLGRTGPGDSAWGCSTVIAGPRARSGTPCGELDLAIRDVRNVVFDYQRPDPPSGGPPG